jgi:hypothetical protein
MDVSDELLPLDAPPSDLIRAHLQHAHAIAQQSGYSGVLPFLEIALQGLDEIEMMMRPVPRTHIVRNW